MAEFYVTFGAQYPREPHPAFPEAHHDGWVTIVADNYLDARDIAFRELRRHWAFIYTPGELNESWFPLGELARFDVNGRVDPQPDFPPDMTGVQTWQDE
jgi:hypothetical protein